MNSPEAPEATDSPTSRRRRFRLALKVTAVSWRDLFQTVGPVALISTAAVLLALSGSTAIITSSFQEFLLAIGGFRRARRAMQLLAAQTTLEPQPHRESRAGRGAVREPEHPKGDGSRFASEPAPLSARGSQIPGLPATI